ncbi:MAG: hypothetical protein MZV70_56475 [Desulfobacterales bacterium]|nr:hypothetical protein [Desulfobacterales bacterium]
MSMLMARSAPGSRSGWDTSRNRLSAALSPLMPPSGCGCRNRARPSPALKS